MLLKTYSGFVCGHLEKPCNTRLAKMPTALGVRKLVRTYICKTYIKKTNWYIHLKHVYSNYFINQGFFLQVMSPPNSVTTPTSVTLQSIYY